MTEFINGKQPTLPYVINQKNNGEAEVYIYGIIGDSWSEDGVTSAKFASDFKQLEEKHSTIKIRINSNGGSIVDGIAMYNVIRGSKAKTEAYIDGVAASMALPVAMACKSIFISKYGMIMTHRAKGMAVGNTDQMKNAIELVAKLENNILEIFSERTRLTVEECRTKYFQNTDRWINPTTAVAERLVDSIFDGQRVSLPQNANLNDMINAYETVLNQSIGAASNNSRYSTVEPTMSARDKYFDGFTFDQMLQESTAEKCLNESPRIFKKKFIETFGQAAWDKSSYKAQCDL